MKFAVVTEVSDTSYAMGDEIRYDGQFTTPPQVGVNLKLTEAFGPQVGATLTLALRTPVFTLGEIMVLDGSGREPIGKGRKPSKWSVEIEEFDTIEEAIERAMSLSWGAPTERASTGSEGSDGD